MVFKSRISVGVISLGSTKGSGLLVDFRIWLFPTMEAHCSGSPTNLPSRLSNPVCTLCSKLVGVEICGFFFFLVNIVPAFKIMIIRTDLPVGHTSDYDTVISLAISSNIARLSYQGRKQAILSEMHPLVHTRVFPTSSRSLAFLRCGIGRTGTGVEWSGVEIRENSAGRGKPSDSNAYRATIRSLRRGSAEDRRVGIDEMREDVLLRQLRQLVV